MSIGEKIRRATGDLIAKREKERTLRINEELLKWEELDRKILEEAKPFLDIFKRTEIYEMFCDIRKECKLIWRTFSSGEKTPAIVQVSIIPKKYRRAPYFGPKSVLVDNQGRIISGFKSYFEPILTTGRRENMSFEEGQLEEREKVLDRRLKTTSLVEKCVTSLRWGHHYGSTSEYEGSSLDERWNELSVDVIRDKTKEEFLLVINPKGVTLSADEWQNREKVEEAVMEGYLREFSG